MFQRRSLETSRYVFEGLSSELSPNSTSSLTILKDLCSGITVARSAGAEIRHFVPNDSFVVNFYMRLDFSDFKL